MLALCGGFVFGQDSTQTVKSPNLKSLKVSFLNQTWMRYSELNPGTTIDGDPAADAFDVGLRRTRLSAFGEIYPKTYVFLQVGMNNFNSLSKREQGLFVHDAVVSYRVLNNNHSLGAGLTAWGGFSRFSSPSVGSILGVDAPLFAQATNGATDQFLRKLSVFANGEIDKFHYRVAFSKPMSIYNSSQYSSFGTNATFSHKVVAPQVHAYVDYAFFEKEKHDNPYFKGYYNGSKKVLNVGAGFLRQNHAMQRINDAGDTVSNPITIFTVDVFADLPLANGGVFNLYSGYFNYNFGKGYLRNIGAMNPANGNSNPMVLNGAGVAHPAIGTGSIFYIQSGYTLASESESLKMMPYAAFTMSQFDRLDEAMYFWDLGYTAFLLKQGTKITLAYQNRPVFVENTNGEALVDSRKGNLICQMQFSF